MEPVLVELYYTSQSAWEMQSGGSYRQRTPQEEDDPRGSHEILIALAEKRQKEVSRPKKKKVRDVASRPSS